MTLEIPTHRTILIYILKDIYTDAQIGPLLGFKGGTAAYLFYQLPRFSVDLDFDLLDTTRDDLVFNRKNEIVKSYGVLKQADKKRYTLFFLLSYEQASQNIKVEVN